ncbi:MAG: TraR/DksA family transcriptional regulator [Phycisphaerales bacterium]
MPSKKPTKKSAPKAKASAKSAKPAAKAGMKPLSGGMKPINTAKPAVSVVPSSPPPPTKKHPNRVPPPPIGKNAPRPMPKKEPVEEKGKKTPKIDYATALSVAAVAVQQKADSSGYVMVNGRRVRMLSGKNVPTKKKSSKASEAAAKAKAEETIDVSEIRTKMGAKELDGYRDVLLRSRLELIGRVDSLEDEALRSSGGNLSNMPLHMADVGTDTFDQEFALNMAASDREKLAEIDAALQRITDRTYGVCQITGKPIPKARLDANPLAKYTVEAARLVERGIAR